ncbi:hypothetical protein [Nocardioides marmotae]|uniref:Mammalian cell entry protein n=1 Tax=Nocardioides marmotae TaxID=2663857 RepID=A0A6I3JAB2_9ACTN|nr:hypothetical protein [Nocardioides marmotae]MCR6030184.1 hypothetical protein [Gordonia jinghuaiqii]MBC9733064.1 hypothetical protein [Nocardioides marmotae]MTB84178.1 hypothetical protein [Nocardioides marmotae]MTB93815.1 hypothetical protein [Nocardioides marmotae]QKE00148.1 hypothetical protein HPC71_02920 [Nocardioides marmotae]
MTGDPTPAGGGRFRVVLLAVLAAVLVVALVASAVMGVLKASGAVGDAGEVQKDREAVMAQARQFMLRLNTYGPDLLEGEQMPEYRETVGEVMTPKFRTSFEQGVVAAEQTVVQGRVGRVAEVFSAGVSDLDGDKATALVAGSFTSSYPRNAKQPDGPRVDVEPVTFRVRVELVRTDGTWLVDDFDPVLAEGEEGSAP